MYFVDTHAHLYAEEFNADRQEMVQRALAAGVKKMLLPNIDSSSITPLLKLCQTNPENCFAMMGLHPCYVNETMQTELASIKNTLDTGNFCAIGEIGIDLYWDRTFLKEQLYAFDLQLQWAAEKQLPVAIHTRNSFNEALEVVKPYKGKVKGVFHCFSGNHQQAEQLIDLGFLLGIGGVLTYKNSGLPAEIEQVDLDHLLLETDAPYLTPVPHRGKRNESAYIPLVAQKLAEIKACPLGEVMERTTNNAQKLFNI
jgi:TatD DNase family protein